MTIDPDEQQATGERGSVTPLVIGMVVCLLLLGAGVTASTSAFLTHRRVQGACDGAAARSADPTLGGYYRGQRHVPSADVARARAADYLAAHHAEITVMAVAHADAVRLDCTATAPVALGTLFGVPTITVHVESAAHAAW